MHKTPKIELENVDWCKCNAPINVKPQGGVVGGGGGAGYLWEIDPENLSLGRDFDTYSMCFPRVGNLTCPPSWNTERTWR